MTQLRLCERCNRHVRVTDASCPFCGVTVTSTALRRAPRMLTRAAIFSAALAGGCEKGPPPKPKPTPTVPKDAAIDAPADANEIPDPGQFQKPYGAPPARRRLV